MKRFKQFIIWGIIIFGIIALCIDVAYFGIVAVIRDLFPYVAFVLLYGMMSTIEIMIGKSELYKYKDLSTFHEVFKIINSLVCLVFFCDILISDKYNGIGYIYLFFIIIVYSLWCDIYLIRMNKNTLFVVRSFLFTIIACFFNIFFTRIYHGLDVLKVDEDLFSSISFPFFSIVILTLCIKGMFITFSAEAVLAFPKMKRKMSFIEIFFVLVLSLSIIFIRYLDFSYLDKFFFIATR